MILLTLAEQMQANVDKQARVIAEMEATLDRMAMRRDALAEDFRAIFAPIYTGPSPVNPTEPEPLAIPVNQSDED